MTSMESMKSQFPPPLVQPTVENRGYNTAQNRDHKYAHICTDVFKSRAQKGREYSHWIDLTLGIHFEAVISESYRTKIRFMPRQTFVG